MCVGLQFALGNITDRRKLLLRSQLLSMKFLIIEQFSR